MPRNPTLAPETATLMVDGGAFLPTAIVEGISHTDHGIPLAVRDWALARLEPLEGESVVVRSLPLPDSLGSVPCALWGPAMGDAPFRESDVLYQRRGKRPWASRVLRPSLARLARSSRLETSRIVTVVCLDPAMVGRPELRDCLVLATMYGGPLAPREPGDPSIQDDPGALSESFRFWRDHALSPL